MDGYIPWWANMAASAHTTVLRFISFIGSYFYQLPKSGCLLSNSNFNCVFKVLWQDERGMDLLVSKVHLTSHKCISTYLSNIQPQHQLWKHCLGSQVGRQTKAGGGVPCFHGVTGEWKEAPLQLQPSAHHFNPAFYLKLADLEAKYAFFA